MPLSYNELAGRRQDRIGALSDGVFAIVMTLIVLEIHVPDPGPIRSESELWAAVVALAPRFVTYLLSFLTLGIFSNGQQTQLNQLARTDRHFTWIQIAFLATVALMPFSTSLLAEFITFRLALLIYWANIAVTGAMLYVSWVYASRSGLLADPSRDVSRAITRRIAVAQTLYAFGAALSAIDTIWSVAFIVAVQLNFAVAPRIPFLSRV